nr:methyl-accepting chemotaxis protein [Sphingomonas quercus]
MTVRIAIGFCAVLLLIPIISVIAANRVEVVNGNLVTMNDLNSVKQRYAINFRGSVHDRAIAVRDVVLAKDARELKTALDTIADREAKYAASAGPLDTMVAPDRAPAPEETSILASIKAVEQKTNPMVKAMIMHRQSGDVAAAGAVLAEARPQFDEWLRVINQFIDFEEARNKEIATDTRSRTQGFTWLILSFCLVAMGIGGGVYWWATGDVRKLSGMTGILAKLTGGEYSVAIPAADTNNEIGQLVRTMASFRERLLADKARDERTTQAIASMDRALERLAEGDLAGRIEAELEGEFVKLKSDFNKAVAALETTLGQVSQTSGEIRSGSALISDAADNLSQRTEQQAAGLQQTAATMNEITAMVRQTAEDAGRANGAVGEAQVEAHRSGEIVTRAVGAMGGIERSSAEISEIISVIDGIAFQTNLLALNAGVEAARAGDAGRGFAVVASEVRALAQRSAEAAKDVKSRITASSDQVAAGVELVGETGRALERISARVSEISNIVSSITESADRQATGLQQINIAMSEIDRVTQQNAGMVEETTAAARNLATEADQLAAQIARFQLGTQPGAPPLAKAPARRAAPAAPRLVGNTALAIEEDWSEF